MSGNRKGLVLFFVSTMLLSVAGCNEQLTDQDRDRFLEAISSGDAETVERLLQAGIDPDSEDFVQNTQALHSAVFMKDLNMVRLLLDAGADPNFQMTHGSTPLMTAVQSPKPSVEISQELLRRGADPNVKNKHGETVLMLAALIGEEEFVDILLPLGVDINVKDQNDRTALYKAVDAGHVSIAEKLLAAGAVPTDEVLRRANQTKQEEMIQLLNRQR